MHPKSNNLLWFTRWFYLTQRNSWLIINVITPFSSVPFWRRRVGNSALALLCKARPSTSFLGGSSSFIRHFLLLHLFSGCEVVLPLCDSNPKNQKNEHQLSLLPMLTLNPPSRVPTFVQRLQGRGRCSGLPRALYLDMSWYFTQKLSKSTDIMLNYVESKCQKDQEANATNLKVFSTSLILKKMQFHAFYSHWLILTHWY
jgi:hypothetical protein